MITPNCHQCQFDWARYRIAGQGHCVIYVNPPGIKHCFQMLPREENVIIMPDNDPQVPHGEELARIALNRQRYETEPELRTMADKIHSDRMLAPPACDSCICLALALLAAKKSIPVTRE